MNKLCLLFKMRVVFFLCLCICFVPVAAVAGDFDGSKPLICAAVKVLECTADGKCDEVSPAGINLPRFFRINFEQEKIGGTLEGGEEKTTPIERLERIDEKLILQGGEQGLGWSMIISDSAGNMTLTAADDQVGFVIFGACTPD